jgi:hypothetical protein
VSLGASHAHDTGHEDGWDAVGRKERRELPEMKCYSKHPLGRVEVVVARLKEVGMKN